MKKHTKKKKAQKQRRHEMQMQPRNAAPTAFVSPVRPRRRRFAPPRPKLSEIATTAASLLGGGGSGVVGGLLAQRGWDPAMVGIALATGGVVGAVTLPAGPFKAAANGLAALGAGQIAFAVMQRMEAKKLEEKLKEDRLKELGVAAAHKALPDGAVVAKPANARFMPAISDAFSNARSYGRVDDEERMLDPDLVFG